VTYTGETKYYRQYLGISYEYGSSLRKSGVILVDARMDDTRPLFLVTDVALAKARERINAYRAAVRQAKEGIAIHV
jgi:hypothetical protein